MDDNGTIKQVDPKICKLLNQLKMDGKTTYTINHETYEAKKGMNGKTGREYVDQRNVQSDTTRRLTIVPFDEYNQLPLMIKLGQQLSQQQSQLKQQNQNNNNNNINSHNNNNNNNNNFTISDNPKLNPLFSTNIPTLAAMNANPLTNINISITPLNTKGAQISLNKLKNKNQKNNNNNNNNNNDGSDDDGKSNSISGISGNDGSLLNTNTNTNTNTLTGDDAIGFLQNVLNYNQSHGYLHSQMQNIGKVEISVSSSYNLGPNINANINGNKNDYFGAIKQESNNKEYDWTSIYDGKTDEDVKKEFLTTMDPTTKINSIDKLSDENTQAQVGAYQALLKKTKKLRKQFATENINTHLKEEYFLWHGTRTSIVENIVVNGFDRNFNIMSAHGYVS